jgi:3-oxoacyl-[acyl-carrier-protein] synthase-1
MKLYLNDLGILSAAGNDGKEILQRIWAGDRSGLVLTQEFSSHPLYISYY